MSSLPPQDAEFLDEFRRIKKALFSELEIEVREARARGKTAAGAEVDALPTETEGLSLPIARLVTRVSSLSAQLAIFGEENDRLRRDRDSQRERAEQAEGRARAAERATDGWVGSQTETKSQVEPTLLEKEVVRYKALLRVQEESLRQATRSLDRETRARRLLEEEELPVLRQRTRELEGDLRQARIDVSNLTAQLAHAERQRETVTDDARSDLADELASARAEIAYLRHRERLARIVTPSAAETGAILRDPRAYETLDDRRQALQATWREVHQSLGTLTELTATYEANGDR